MHIDSNRKNLESARVLESIQPVGPRFFISGVSPLLCTRRPRWRGAEIFTKYFGAASSADTVACFTIVLSIPVSREKLRSPPPTSALPMLGPAVGTFVRDLTASGPTSPRL
jgi:hypothetical protein